MTELPAAECAGFLWVALDPDATLDIAGFLGPLADELDSWGIGRWTPLGEKVLDYGDQLEARDRHLRGELPLRDRAQDHLRDHRSEQLHRVRLVRAPPPIVFPLNGILDLDNVPEDQWDPLQNMVVIYALFPNIVLSATIANGELFRVYPGDVPGRSITVHQNSTPLDMSDESVAAGAQAVFEYAHGTVRDEDYALVEKLQVNLASEVREHLVFGRNEPGLQHRHQTWTEAISR